MKCQLRAEIVHFLFVWIFLCISFNVRRGWMFVFVMICCPSLFGFDTHTVLVKEITMCFFNSMNKKVLNKTCKDDTLTIYIIQFVLKKEK